MTSSYSPKEVEKLHDVYCDNPCLETVYKLAVMLNRPKRSIISKLVKEGIYITKSYTTKLGETPITKLQLVRNIEDYIDDKLPGLDKAPKVVLKKLESALEDLSVHLEEALDTINKDAEVSNIRDEMRILKL